MIWSHRFASLQSFSDPHQIIKDDHNQDIAFGLFRYNQIIDECYIISKNIHTSYLDLMEVTPKERDRMLELLSEEAKKQQEFIDKQKAKAKMRH